MNPKRAVLIGALVLMMAMAVIPSASALSVTRDRLDLVPGLADSETYTMTMQDNILYVVGVKWYDKELSIYSWEGQGYEAEELSTWDMGDYIYYPTDSIWFEDKLYISAINWSSPDGNDEFYVPLFVFDPDTNDIDVVDTFQHGMIGQMAVWDNLLVLMADYNTIYYSDDPDDGFTAKFIEDDIETVVLGTTDYYYLYDIHNMGITSMGGDLYLQTRNCTWMHDEAKTLMSADDEPLVTTYEHFISESIDLHQLTDVDEDWETEVTTHSLTRILYWRLSGTIKNITNPLFTLQNDEEFGFVSGNAVYTSDDSFSYTRIYNGDSTLYNPEPIFSHRLSSGSTYKDNSIIVNTVNLADNAPACPAPINQPDIGYMVKPQPITKTVMQGFSESVIPVERNAYEIDVTNGERTFIFSNSVQVLWDEVDMYGASVVIASTTGVHTWHVLTIDLTGAIYSLMLILLIAGICCLVWGLGTYNRGFEDYIAFSLAGGLFTGAGLLFFYPSIFLSWLIVFVPIIMFFALLYILPHVADVKKVDFRLKRNDILWIVGIFGFLIILEVFYQVFTNASFPGWLPPP
jgi:hypothetical protein